MISCLFLKASRCSSGVQLSIADTFDLLPAARRSPSPLNQRSSLHRQCVRASRCSSGVQLLGTSSAGKISPHNSLKERSNFLLTPHRDRGLTPESGIQYPRGVKGWGMGSVSNRATLHLRKALQGLAASGHPFRVSLRATAQARSPCGCRKCVPFAPEEENPVIDRTREASRSRPTTNILRASRTTKPL